MIALVSAGIIALTVLVFQVWLGEPVINDLPIFLVILMMGLGMDRHGR
jgi:putative drug exporter of the RND superfamily